MNLFDEAQLAHLTDDEVMELAGIQAQVVGGDSFVETINRAFPAQQVPRHLMPIVDAVEGARVMPIMAAFSYSPGAAKTTILQRLLAAWLAKYPADTCGYVTSSQTKAFTKSREIQAIAVQLGVELATTAVGHWTTTAGGGLIATGAAGLTSFRITGLLVYDDPYTDASEAESEITGPQIFKQFNEVAMTRLAGGSIIVVHTRWDDKDLIARAVGELGFTYVNIPAIAEDRDQVDDVTGLPFGPDPIGRAKGESFWPENYPLAQCDGPCGHARHLETIRDGKDGDNGIDEWTWNALYQGRPRRIGGEMFKRAGFTIVARAPEGATWGRAWDFAGSKKKGSAYTVGVRGCLVDGTLYIDAVARERVASQDLIDYVVGIAHEDGPDVAIDYPQDPGQAAIGQVEYLARELSGYSVEYTPEKGEKQFRARPLAAMAKVREGCPSRICLVAGVWNEAFIREFVGFPRGKFKDQIDATVRLLALLLRQWTDDSVGGAPRSYGRS